MGFASIKESYRVVGYFAHTSSGEVLCDGDACIIAGTEDRMRFYVDKMAEGKNKFIIKKTRFGEIMTGMGLGAAYAFDEGSYQRFLPLIRKISLGDFPSNDCFSETSGTVMHFVRIQVAGE